MVFGNLRYWHAAASRDTCPLREMIEGDSRQEDGTRRQLSSLDEPVMTEYGAWIETPLLCAIRHNNIHNVRVLLEAGANPDGVAREDMLQYVAWILKSSGDGKEVIIDMDDQELTRLLRDAFSRRRINLGEVQQRREAGSMPFWHSLHSIQALDFGQAELIPEEADPHNGNAPVTSLVVAAWHGRMDIVDLLLQHGADETYWANDKIQRMLPQQPTRSSLCSIAPMHAAVQRGHADMVKHLLSLGFDPNVVPSGDLLGATTALHHSILTKYLHGTACFDVLAADSRTDFSFRTPGFNISIIHLAVATLDTNFVKKVLKSVDLDSAGVTASGHNVLHIACLPASDSEIKFYNVNPAAQESVHDCLDMPGTGYGRPTREQHKLQSDMVMFLSETSDDAEQMLVAKDIYGNTPLHYLAAAQEPNEDLIGRLKSITGVSENWQNSKNEKGYAPHDIYQRTSLSDREPR